MIDGRELLFAEDDVIKFESSPDEEDRCVPTSFIMLTKTYFSIKNLKVLSVKT